MASYDATIRLLADISPADKALDRLQSKIQAIKKASTIVIRGPSDASPGVKKQIEGYSTLISLLERYKKGLREVPTLTKESIFQDPGKGPIGDAFRKAKKEVADLSIALANAGDNFKEVFQTQRESLGIGKDVRNYANQLEFAASILGRIREGFKDNTAEARNLEAAIRNIVNELQSVRPGSGLTTEIQSAVGPRTQAGLSGPFGISAEQINAALEQKAEQFVRLQQKQINNLSQINRLRKAGLNVNQADTLVSAAGEQLRKGNVTEAAKLVKEAEEELRILSRINGILRRNRNERRRERIQQGRSRQRRASTSPGRIAVGAAFPALFGAGPAGILGGAIGEAFGPLGGVVGSALGAPVDAFVAKTVEVGQALNSTSSALDFVRENSLFSSKATEELAYQLEELGDVEGVAKLLTEELVEKIGNNGVQALQDLGKESDETTRLWNELTLQLQTLIAGPLTDFLKIVNQVLGSMTTRGRFEALQSDLAGNQEFQTEVNRLRAVRGRGARQGALTIEDMQGLINQFAPTVPKTAKIGITPQDRRNFDRKQANDTKRAAREAQRIALAVLNLNTALLQENLKQFDLKTRYMALSLEEIDRLTEANYRLDERFKLEKQLLEKQREQALVKDPANEYLINKLYDERLDTAQGIVELAKFENQEKIKQLQAAERLAAIERRTGVAFGALLNESGMFAEDPLLGRAESPLAFGTGAQMQGLINQELALERIIEKYTQIGEAASLASELVTFGIRDMVSGTRSAEEVFAEFLQNIADMLLRTAATMIAQYIALGIARAFALGQTARVGPEMFNLNNTSFFGNAPALGGLGFRANGGPVGAGQSYIVGERGPELFVPSRSGSIVPNDRLGGGDNVSVVVNVDAKGTSVQGNDQEGNQLGRVLSAAVKAELIKQKRPGGLLA